jgi:hypothetical protein
MPVTRVPNSNKQFSDNIRRRDGLWIPYRRVNYYYWYTFLQFADESDDFSVDWKKYKSWGGKNEVMGRKFGEWWEDNWKDNFGLKEKTDKQKYPFTTIRPKTEAIRISQLCWRFKDAPMKIGKRKNTLDIANAVYRYELGLDKRRKTPRRNWGDFDIDTFNPLGQKWDDKEEGFYDVDQKELTNTVNRALKRARETMGRVCEGQFP